MYYRFTSSLAFILTLVLAIPSLANSTKLLGVKPTFERYQISTDFKVILPVLALDLVHSEQESVDELIVIGEDNQQVWLAAYAFNEKVNNFVLLDKLLLDRKYFAFDVSENGQGLYLLAKNQIVSLHYGDGEDQGRNVKAGLYLKHVEKVNSIFLLNESSFILKKNFIQDINQDGLDDIVLSDFEQMNLWLSNKEEQGLSYQALPIRAQAELIRSSVNFKPMNLFLGDFNLDTRQDVAWISKGQVNYFDQIPQGKFSINSQSVALADNIEGKNWWQIRGADGENLDQSNLVHRSVERIQDVNGDGLTDIIVRLTQSSGVLNRRNIHEFYFGFVNQHGHLEYPETASTVIQAEGTSTGLKIIDVNNDGKFEVLITSFELSVGNIIGALMSGGIDQNVQIFALNDNDIFDEDALIHKEVELRFSLTSGQSGEPIVLLTDVNGDALQDLVLSSGKKRLKIYLGQKSSRVFSRKASKHKLLLPKNGALFEHHDLNHDGKEDFIMHYGRLDEKSMENKITILMSK
ncbi:MAG: VCBS repeat-containing protein [Litorilituus sp.]|jgi:hypothetical protein|nr:VCBS repeat-containing protein [Litorilituus sp.]